MVQFAHPCPHADCGGSPHHPDRVRADHPQGKDCHDHIADMIDRHKISYPS